MLLTNQNLLSAAILKLFSHIWIKLLKLMVMIHLIWGNLRLLDVMWS